MDEATAFWGQTHTRTQAPDEAAAIDAGKAAAAVRAVKDQPNVPVANAMAMDGALNNYDGVCGCSRYHPPTPHH